MPKRQRNQLAPANIVSFRKTLLQWGRTNRRAFPWRTESDPFRVLVAELLLQRSRATTVAKVYETLFSRWPDAASLARANRRSVEAVVRPLGLTARSRTLKRLAQRVLELEGVPASIDELMELPGVGRYVATATCVVAFNVRAGVVDGVTARVYRRYFGASSDLSPSLDAGLWSIVAEVTPRQYVREWNWAVLDLASAICLPKIPRCNSCPLVQRCAFAEQAFSRS
jgi:A/G-specific adenine glycosylase